MNVSNEFSCFDCPALEYINSELASVQDVRDRTLSVYSIVLSERGSGPHPANTHDSSSLPPDFPDYGEATFAYLDAAESKLNNCREIIVESCAGQRPVVSSVQLPETYRLLQCGSAIARNTMKHLASKPIHE